MERVGCDAVGWDEWYGLVRDRAPHRRDGNRLQPAATRGVPDTPKEARHDIDVGRRVLKVRLIMLKK